MTSPRYAQMVSRLLAQEAERHDVTPPSEHARAAAILAIEQAIVASTRRKKIRRFVWGSSALAAAAALFVVGANLRSHRALPLVTPPQTAIATGPAAVVLLASNDDNEASASKPVTTPLTSGAHVVALPHGHAQLAFANGTKVDVEPGGELTIVEADASSVLELISGAARAHVAKLRANDRFVMKTVDAEVEVHGTSFRVALVPSDPLCGEGAKTRVSVFEGVVTVRYQGAEYRLAPGDEWPRGCPAGKPIALAPPAVVDPARILPPSLPSSSRSSSTLALQNDLFAQSIAARRRGNPREAIQNLETLLAKFPDGALAESAAADRMKILADIDPLAAMKAAHDYVARYPNGFARADADALLAHAP
jgi:hypothetical protein